VTQADVIVKMLMEAGVRRLFGVPGGGTCADLIEAAQLAGLPFTLAHTETAAAFMATAQAEITGSLGAVVTTLGPGAASVMNGVANAWLERAPLIVLTDCAGGAEHQGLDQPALFRPVTKWSAQLSGDHVAETLAQAIEIALSGRPGPVHLDVGGLA